MVLVIAVTVGVLGGAAGWVIAIRRRYALEVSRSLAVVDQQLPKPVQLPSQRVLAEAVGRWEAKIAAFAETERAAQYLSIPVPPPPMPSDDEATTLSRLAEVLRDPRVGMAVAGGEQLVQNVLEASPHIIQHAGDALVALYGSELAKGALGGWQGVGQALAGHAMSGDAAGSLADDVRHIVEAGHHLATGVDPSAMHGFHFPWVTALVSTVREGALVAENKTSAARAAAHIAADVGGAAAGGFAGAKLGALIGSAIAPGPGTAIGAAIGATFGGAGGRLAAEGVKQMPLKAAVQDLEQTHGAMTQALTSSAHQVVERVRERSLEGQGRVTAIVRRRPAIASACDPHDLAQVARAALAFELSLLREAREQVGRARSAAVTSLSPLSAAKRALVGSMEADAHRNIRAAAERVTTALMSSERALSGIATSGEPMAGLRAASATALPADARLDRLLSDAAARVAANVEVAERRFSAWSSAVAREYHSAAASVVGTAQSETGRHRQEFGRWKTVVDVKLTEVKRHQAALGISWNSSARATPVRRDGSGSERRTAGYSSP